MLYAHCQQAVLLNDICAMISLNSPLDDSMHTVHMLPVCCMHNVPKDSIHQLSPLPGLYRASTLALSILQPRFDPGIGQSLYTQVSGPFALIFNLYYFLKIISCMLYAHCLQDGCMLYNTYQNEGKNH